MNKKKDEEKKNKKEPRIKHFFVKSKKTEDQSRPFLCKEPVTEVTLRKYATEKEAQDFCDRANGEGYYGVKKAGK